MNRPFRSVVAGIALIALTALPAYAQFGFGGVVFDPTNYSQNVLTAARELQQVNNQIRSLANEATSLVNQARNLASLPYSSLAALDQSITATQQLLTQAQNIAYKVSTIDQAFSHAYPAHYGPGTSAAQLQSDAVQRWQNARAGFQDAMHIQAGAVANLDSTRAQIDALINASQSSTGALQAAQSGNQLIALQTKQLADLTAVLASIARAQSLDAARKLESGEQAQVQSSNFLNYGAGYQPGAAQMFH